MLDRGILHVEMGRDRFTLNLQMRHTQSGCLLEFRNENGHRCSSGSKSRFSQWPGNQPQVSSVLVTTLLES